MPTSRKPPSTSHSDDPHDPDLDAVDDARDAEDAASARRELELSAAVFVIPAARIADGPKSEQLCVRPVFPPEPDLTALGHFEVVMAVLREFLPGEVILVGRKPAKLRDAKPFAALVIAADRADTARRLLSIFEAITEGGGVPFWKLNPYSREAIEKHAQVTLSERWDGKALALEKGTWADEHIARIVYLSGDHDVGRTDPTEHWEKRIPFDEALAMYWVKIQRLGAGPVPTYLQDSGRGFTPIWQLDPPMQYGTEVKVEAQSVLRQLRERARGLAVDDGIYMMVNPFMKAPGAIHPKTSRTITFFSVAGDTYNIGEFHEYFENHKPWLLNPAPVRLYPDDPVPRRSRSAAAKRSSRQRLGPSYAVLDDLTALLAHWKYDLTGRSNAFFRVYAWHRRNILMTEVGIGAKRAGKQLDESSYVKRVYTILRSEMDELNARTGNRIDNAKMNGYFVKFPKKPKSPTAFAADLMIDVHLARQLRLKTLIPLEEKKVRAERHERKRARRLADIDEKNKALDEMILSGAEYDYSKYSREQVKYRRMRLIEEGYYVPDRRRGRRRKMGEGSPIVSPSPNR